MLSTKQISYLKSLGQKMQPAVRIGKSGLTDEVVSSTDAALTANELVKVRILSKTSPVEPKDALVELSEKLNAALVQTIGHNGLLYRKNGKKPKIIFPF